MPSKSRNGGNETTNKKHHLNTNPTPCPPTPSLLHSHTHTLSHSHTHSLTHCHSHTYSLTHTHTLSLTHTHSLTHTVSNPLWIIHCAKRRDKYLMPILQIHNHLKHKDRQDERKQRDQPFMVACSRSSLLPSMTELQHSQQQQTCRPVVAYLSGSSCTRTLQASRNAQDRACISKFVEKNKEGRGGKAKGAEGAYLEHCRQWHALLWVKSRKARPYA